MPLYPSPYVPGAIGLSQLVSGCYYTTPYAASLGTLSALNSNGVMRGVPFPVGRGVIAATIGIHTSVAGLTGAVTRLGIYTDLQGQPGFLVVDAGTVASSCAVWQEITINQALSPANYWLVGVTQGASTATNTSVATGLFFNGSAGATPPVPFPGWATVATTSVPGALPATAPTGQPQSQATSLAVFVKIA